MSKPCVHRTSRTQSRAGHSSLQRARAPRPASGRMPVGGSWIAAAVDAAQRRVRRRRHRDERPRRRGLRAHRGRRRARRRRRAARALSSRSSRVRAPLGRAGSSASPGSRRRWSARRRRPATRAAGARRASRGRVLVAHNARASTAACSRQAFARAGLELARPAGALHRRAGPAVRAARAPARARRRSPPRSASRSHGAHRALVDAETCARVFCALFPRLCAHAATRRRGARAAPPRRRRRATPRRPRRGRRRARARAPPTARSRRAARRPGRLHLPRRRRPPALRRQVRLAAHARALALRAGRRRAAWTEDAELVDYRPTESELGRARAGEPADQASCARPATCALKRVGPPTSTCAAGSTSRSRSSRSRSEPAAGHGVNVGPLRGRAAARRAGRAARLALRPAPLRPPPAARRDHPPPTGRWGAASRPASATSTRTSTAGASTRRWRCSRGPATGAARCWRHLDGADARGRGASGATSAPRPCAGAARRSRRCSTGSGGVLRATHAAARLVLAPHPDEPRFDAFWIVGGPRRGLGPAARRTETSSAGPRSPWPPVRGPARRSACLRTPCRSCASSPPGSSPTRRCRCSGSIPHRRPRRWRASSRGRRRSGNRSAPRRLRSSTGVCDGRGVAADGARFDSGSNAGSLLAHEHSREPRRARRRRDLLRGPLRALGAGQLEGDRARLHRGRAPVARGLHRVRAPGRAVELLPVLLGRGRGRRQPLPLHRRRAAARSRSTS